jgi:hypothetical protein
MLRLLALAMALGAAVPVWGKDLVLQRKLTMVPGPKPTEQTEYYTDKKIVTEGAAERTLVDLEAKTISTLDKTKKTYWTMTFAELRRDLTMQREVRRKELDALPKEVRELMRLDQKATATEADGRQKIAGYDAREYRIEAGPVSGTVWATEELVFPKQAQEWRAVSSGTDGPVGGLAEALSKVKGFPLKTVTAIGSDDELQTLTDEVLSVTEESPPPARLTIPDDWKKIPRPDAPDEPEETEEDEDE